MIKFKKKEHIQMTKESGKLVIYYNVSDIFLGITLLVLVVFFIHDYLSHNFKSGRYGNAYPSQATFSDQYKNFPPSKLPTQP